MAVTLPAVVLFYELHYHPPASFAQLPGWVWRHRRAVMISGIMACAYIWGRAE